MANSIRFFFDEHVPDAAADALRARGIDVITADEANRLGEPDEAQLRFALAEGRVLVTHDSDYLALAAEFLERGTPFAGVAYSHPTKSLHDVGGLVRALLLIHGVLTVDEMMNHVEYL